MISGPFSGLVAKCREEGLDASDLAVLRSLVLATGDAESLRVALREALDCPEFATTAFEVWMESRAKWHRDTLVQVAEVLLFHGLDRQAEQVAEGVRRASPSDTYGIRLWAISAGSPEAALKRFAAGLAAADDPEVVRRDAREYAVRHARLDLLALLDTPP